LVVSWIDNLIRPLVISSTGHVPFLLVVFGILGGVLAFGLAGVFIGPFVVATLLAVWREWQADLDRVDEEPRAGPAAEESLRERIASRPHSRH
jgi:predicted PurR-regulated permease PerM